MARTAALSAELNADQVDRLLAAAQRRPQLADIPWHDDEAVFDGHAPHRPAPAPDAVRSFDAARRRIRDRYIGVRFAGVARGAGDLENPLRVMKAARLAFDEGEPETALELLSLAIDQNAGEPQLRLAELEIACLARQRARFVTAARDFHELFPRSAEWPEVVRLGRRLAPGEPLFARASVPADGVPAGDPAPRWIESPWDAARELEAAEFHRAMTHEASRAH
jgi:hypothetical protein